MKPKSGNGQPRIPQKKTTMSLNDFYEKELPLLADVVSFCNNLPVSLYADTTVVKSAETVFRGSLLSQNRLVAEEYLLNFRRSEADLGVVIGTSNYRMPMAVAAAANRDLEESEDDLIPLPPSRNERAPIGPIIRSRRSQRRYSGEAVSLQDLATVLWHSAGVTGKLHLENAPDSVVLGNTSHVDLRANMSGGGLYPVDLFIVALNVEQLPARAYRYLPKHHALKPAGSGAAPEVGRLAQFGEIQAEKASFLICYLYNFFENSRKYGEAGLAFAFIEAGVIAAHVHLLCTACGLGSCDVGSFSKRRLEQMFDADGISKHMIHMTVVGTLGTNA
jgi:SagB-type dehydrogenase family enzyme